MAGADLANLVNEGALLAARKNHDKIFMGDLEEAKDRVMLGAERKSLVMKDEERRLTAFHEAGHAVCAMMVKGNDPLHKVTAELDVSPDPVFNELVPADSKAPFDVLTVINRLVDDGDFLEVQKDWAKNIVVGFARIHGIVCGIVANQPCVKAGTLDIDSSDKAARFIRTCNVYSIPLVTLVDIPGFMPGLAQERGGIIRHGAKMLFAYASATVPKITVIMRKAYGGAYLAMCSSDMRADAVYAWPTAEIAVMGADGAVKVLFKREIAAAADPKAKEAELAAEYRAKFSSPFAAARKGMITDVIEPAQTRAVVGMALRNTLSKRETRPPKKHGNIPL
jgi:propionyl-CoA carboxylase beta chain